MLKSNPIIIISHDLCRVEPETILTCDWEEFATDEGVKYYYNSKTETSVWEPPSEWVAFQAAIRRKVVYCLTYLRKDELYIYLEKEDILSTRVLSYIHLCSYFIVHNK